MTRTVKDPEVRKKELVDAAEILFREKGYSSTSVADIVNRVGVAHGLFYYYFDSKEDIIDAIVERMVEEFVVSINKIIDNDQLNAKEKFKHLFFQTFNRKKEKIYFFEYYNQKENRLLYSKYMDTISNNVVPLITQIIKQGIEENVFDTEYPKEAVEFWLYGRLSIDISSFPENIEKIVRSVRAEAFFLDRILGTKDQFITKMWNELLEDFEYMVQESNIYNKSEDDHNG
ncbi:MAG: TetR/AcrR family transcriptional regulator [Thermoplasmatota archaeon]